MGAVAGLIDGFRNRSAGVGFLDRLDDVRARLIWALVVLMIGVLVGFYLVVNFDVLGIFTRPIIPYLNGERLKYLSPTDPFFITLKLAVCVGFVLTLPYLLAQVWAVITPLMRPPEKKLMAPAVIASVVLFAAGAAFCYLLVLPLMLRFTMGFQAASLEQSIVVGEYLKIVLRMLIAFGLAFELPIAILIGTLLGVVTPELLISKRRHAFATLTVVGAVVTPPDLSSLVLLMIPIALLYEISIVMSRAVLAGRVPTLAEPEV